MKTLLAAAAFTTLLGWGTSFAATMNPFTIDFGLTTPAGFTITGESVNNGNCPFGTKPCSHLNDNATITVTNSALFTISSATFRFQGEGNGNGVLFEGLKLGTVVGSAEFKIGASTGFGDGSLGIGSTPIGKKVDYKALFNASFAGIDTFRITSNKVGDNKSAQLRVDTFMGTVAAVPLPAAGWLLIGALGGLGALRRFRKAA